MAAWLHPFLFIIAIVYGGIEQGTFHFSDQLLTTKIAWIELLMCGWALPLFYKNISQDRLGFFAKIAILLRITVYLILPLIPIPHIYRHYPQFIVSGFWLSIIICWCLYRALNIRQLVIEFHIIFYIAASITILNTLVSAITVFSLSTLLNIIISFICISLLFLIESPFKAKKFKYSKYRKLFCPTYYLICFCVSSLVYGFTGNLAISILATLIIMTYGIFKTPVFAFIHSFFRLNYGLVLGVLILIPGILITQAESINIIVLLMFGLIGLYITHKRCYQNKVFWLNYQNFNIQLWVGHGILVLCYLAISRLLFGDILSIATTISFLLHALAVLFMTLKDYYKNILNLSLLLFSFCTLKVIFYDMQDYSLFHKMIVMSAVGAILLVGAYQFQKVKENSYTRRE